LGHAHCALLTCNHNVLEVNNFKVNPHKCEWAVQETDWLGYWLTPTGLKPWKKKIAAILAMQHPQTVTQLHSFIGTVNFYWDMFPQRSHTLAPLTSLAKGKGKLTWTPTCQQAFEAMKALLAKDTFLWYLDHNKCFDIYCNASEFQLGTAFLQEGVPVAFYSRKLIVHNATILLARRNYFLLWKPLRSFAPCYMDALTYTSIQTIGTIRSPTFKHNVFCDGNSS
jgi:RNase H-like domain found in reverse transcriptase